MSQYDEYEKVLKLIAKHFNKSEEESIAIINNAFQVADQTEKDIDRLVDYVKELELILLGIGEGLPIMREDVRGLIYDIG